MKIQRSSPKTHRVRRVRGQLQNTPHRPRLSVFRSHHHISAQIIDDQQGTTLASASSQQLATPPASKTSQAQLVGQKLAQAALKLSIKKVKFDRGPYKYHGRVKTLAEAARKAGLEF